MKSLKPLHRYTTSSPPPQANELECQLYLVLFGYNRRFLEHPGSQNIISIARPSTQNHTNVGQKWLCSSFCLLQKQDLITTKVCAELSAQGFPSASSGQGSIHFNSSRMSNGHLPRGQDKQKSDVFIWKYKMVYMLDLFLYNSGFAVWSNMKSLSL